ncbi:MAG TPA: glycoside hydrolase family 16 protein [Phyllobacterium sp.]|nr:glycoside hydrolase family 16 protein [Phyllobacterium sp.]
MARLASTDVNMLLDFNPRWMKFLEAEKASAAIKVTLADVTVLPTALEARLKLALSNPPRDSVIGSFLTRNGTGTNEGSNYVKASGAFIFHPDDKTEQEIVIVLKGNNAFGKTIEVMLSSTIAGATIAKQSGWIRFSMDPQQAVESGSDLVFKSNFIAGFECSDTGLKADGSPCWQSRPAHGRTQDGNKELGLYVDPVLFPGTDPFPIINGKRVLRSEKLATPIQYSDRSWDYTASMITSRKLRTIAPGGRVEARFAMPVLGKRGAWPAFWLMPTSGAWPPENDMMEWPINSTHNAWTYFSTQHWSSSTGSHQQRSYPLDIRQLGIANVADLTGFHTYGIEITDEEIIFYFDGVKTSVMENRSPGQSWYVLLNMAMGGSWPGSPTADTVFPCDMILDWIKFYEPSAQKDPA